jgi:predicted DNA binding protein
VREFTETVEERFPSASLVARRERDRAVQTAPGLRAALGEHLTERNLEVVERAYHSGFFEWPRENSGQEVADALDISQPTFNRHVRAAERALFEVLFEGPA